MNRLTLPAAAAIHEHLMGPVVENPRRLGKQLDAPFEGLWSTSRGEYRALYTVNETEATVTIVGVAHRREAYRTP